MHQYVPIYLHLSTPQFSVPFTVRFQCKRIVQDSSLTQYCHGDSLLLCYSGIKTVVRLGLSPREFVGVQRWVFRHHCIAGENAVYRGPWVGFAPLTTSSGQRRMYGRLYMGGYKGP